MSNKLGLLLYPYRRGIIAKSLVLIANDDPVMCMSERVRKLMKRAAAAAAAAATCGLHRSSSPHPAV